MIRSIFFLGILFLVLSCLGFAAEMESPGTPLRKLQRGFLNIALSPMDISHEIRRDQKRDDIIPGWATGLGRGACFAAGRALAGVYEMLSFPIPFPANYEPVVTPEFVWEHPS
ncbi:MAG: exosortase system-associated protein, TIGR04073 family [Candidatus Omnitrophica bacterium]|nr:exosortase system-associated protein, TIGR04073 family [Candidatus Omnitrophota bacterium]